MVQDAVESAASRVRKKYSICNNDAAGLRKVLEAEFDYEIDNLSLTTDRGTSSIRSIVTPLADGKKKLFINNKFDCKQTAYIYARELGMCTMELTGTIGLKSQTFQSVLNDYKASYFAGALFIDENKFVTQLKDLFKNPDSYHIREESARGPRRQAHEGRYQPPLDVMGEPRLALTSACGRSSQVELSQDPEKAGV